MQIFIHISNHHFNMAQLQQCCLFHDLLLPLLYNQVVASETSRTASSCCVAKKKKKKQAQKITFDVTFDVDVCN